MAVLRDILTSILNLTCSSQPDSDFFSVVTPYALTAAEKAASVTPKNYAYAPGNVLRYGADPTGATDSTAAFQNAHNSNNSILIPVGVYLLNATTVGAQFTINKSNFEMVGQGPQSQLKHTNSGAVTGTISVIQITPPASTTISNLHFADFRITGPTPTTGGVANAYNACLGICFHDSLSTGNITDVLVENVAIEQMEMAAFALGGLTSSSCQRIRFDECIARNGCQDGFNDFANGTDISWFNCHAHDLNGFGHEHGSARVLIDGGTIRRCGQAGIGLEYDTSVVASNRRIIKNVVISDIANANYASQPGISLGQSFNPYSTEIIGVSISRCGGHGIIVNGSNPSQISILDCAIQDIGSGSVNTVGIQFGNVATNCSVLGNSILNVSAGYSMSYGVAGAGAGDYSTLIADNNIVGATVRVSMNQPTRIRRGIPSVINLAGASNTGGAETTLMSYTLPANALDVVNQSIKITAWGITAANANAKRVRIYFGSNVIFDTTAIAANNVPWRLEVTIGVATLTIIETSGNGQFNNALVTAVAGTFTGQSLTVSNLIKVTGQGTANGDVTEAGLLIEFPDSY